MEKTERKQKIASCAQCFSQATFQELITHQIQKIRDKIQKNKIPRRLIALERLYGNSETAITVYAYEKVKFAIRRYQRPHESESCTKHIVRQEAGHAERRRKAAFLHS